MLETINLFTFSCVWIGGIYLYESPINGSVQFSLVAQLCPTVCDAMDCSTPGLPVHYQLLELTQTHVH